MSIKLVGDSRRILTVRYGWIDQGVMVIDSAIIPRGNEETIMAQSWFQYISPIEHHPIKISTDLKGALYVLGRKFKALNNAASGLDPAAYQELVDQIDRLLVQAQDLQRKQAGRERAGALVHKSYDQQCETTTSIMSPSAPWLVGHFEDYPIPCMISKEEKSYYNFIGAFYQGKGRVIELGPWLGGSTRHIVAGLAGNPNFANEKLYVYDDFVWRSSWMDGYVSESKRVPNHASFQHLFEKYTAQIANRMIVERVKIVDYEGNEALPPLSWGHGPIEFAFVDCGRTLRANQAWYREFRPYFIPGCTLLVMQDWRLHREVPRKWFNQTLLFTESIAHEVELLHEVCEGGVAAFLVTR